jgi:hypothetical protein
MIDVAIQFLLDGYSQGVPRQRVYRDAYPLRKDNKKTRGPPTWEALFKESSLERSSVSALPHPPSAAFTLCVASLSPRYAVNKRPSGAYKEEEKSAKNRHNKGLAQHGVGSICSGSGNSCGMLGQADVVHREQCGCSHQGLDASHTRPPEVMMAHTG